MKHLPKVKVTIVLDSTDALAVGQNLRTLSRQTNTPLGVREVFNRVGSEMFHAALTQMGEVPR